MWLAESSGPWFGPGWPTLYCSFGAVHLPGTPHDRGTISLLCRDHPTGTWRELVQSVTIDQSREILADLTAVGLPGRAPDVEGVVDTSDGWTRIVFWVRVEGGSRCVEIDMHSSGFRGGDAKALRKLFRRLFALAGFADWSAVIYGEW
jgi:hypothetical protein